MTTLADTVGQALEDAALKRSEAELFKARAKRIYSELVIRGEGKSIAEREHWARQEARYVEAEEKALAAASDANLAEARADHWRLRFEEWRSLNATNRAQMNLR